MNCPNCYHPQHSVIETRTIPGNAIRRRKNCLRCGTRWTTYERCEPVFCDLNFNSRGSKNHNAVLTEDNVRQMRVLYDNGKNYATIAREYGVSQATVSRIIRRLNWTHVV